jgi:hypothetical protein
MEVHAHTPTPRKKWTHYFWEFLMLFLAVFCGFLAENQREHIIEHHREKQYMRSMLDDLAADDHMLAENIHIRNSRLKMIDSLVILLTVPAFDGKVNEAYFYARSISPPANIFSTDGTVQQLKSAGNLRLLRDREIANKILVYDQQVRQALFEMGDEVELRSEYRQLASRLFHSRTFFDMQHGDSIVKPSRATGLFSNDPALINQFIGALQYLKKVHTAQLARSQNLKEKAEALIGLIKESYHLK